MSLYLSIVIFKNTLNRNIERVPHISSEEPVAQIHHTRMRLKCFTLNDTIAGAVMNIRYTPAMTAVFGELWWLPIDLIVDKLSVNVFHGMIFDLPDTVCVIRYFWFWRTNIRWVAHCLAIFRWSTYYIKQMLVWRGLSKVGTRNGFSHSWNLVYEAM